MFQIEIIIQSQSPTLPAAFSAGGVGGDGGDVLDPADLDAITDDGPEGGLSTGSGCLVAGSSSGSEPDVDGSDLELLQSVDHINGSQHGSVRGRLVSVRLDLHAAGDSGQGFAAGQIGHVDEGVVPGRQDVAYCEEVTLDVGGTELSNLLLSFLSDFFSGDGLLAFLGLGLLDFSHGGRCCGGLHFSHFMDSNNLLNQFYFSQTNNINQLNNQFIIIIDLQMQPQGSQRPEIQTTLRQNRSESESPRSRSPSRSRDKPQKQKYQRNQTYLRKNNLFDQRNQQKQQTQAHDSKKEQQKQKIAIQKQLLRSFLRIEQEREQPIDKFVKIVWIYKNKLPYDAQVHDIMKEPRKYLEKLAQGDIGKMLPLVQGHRAYQKMEKSALEQYWVSLQGIIQYLLSPENKQKLEPEFEQKIREIIIKPLPELVKLQKQTQMILKSQAFGSNLKYWKQVQARIKVKKMQLILNSFYDKFKEENSDKIEEENQNSRQQQYKEPVSPTLVPYSSVNPKLLVEEEAEKQVRKKLAENIFKQEFQRQKQKLEVNLSLPHNHGLLSTEIINQQTNTYDQITKQIIEFQKYKRMQDDEEDFNDWVPCQTEGRFRETKPVCINRVRVACQWNKYNNMHYTEDNPPPKTVQGYKFNIFYPDLYDQQKTPQYYLQSTDDPNYCIIKFKAGPPYKDIAFKILRKQWDFTEKSGFESIFAKGILHLYFNFKKPRFRI